MTHRVSARRGALADGCLDAPWQCAHFEKRDMLIKTPGALVECPPTCDLRWVLDEVTVQRDRCRDCSVYGALTSTVGERQRDGSVQRGRGGKLQSNLGRSGTRESIRPGTPLQVSQSVRPSSEPSRARHQRGRASRTHSWGNRTSRSESSSRSNSKLSVGTSTVFFDRTELKKVNFVAASRPDSPDRPLGRSVHWGKICVGQRIDGSCNWTIVGNWRRCSLLCVRTSANLVR